MSYVPLRIHTHYSLQLGISKPKDIVSRCNTLGIKACAITDLGNIAGTINFYKELSGSDIKPILGVELYINDGELSKLTLLAKNLNGWKSLIKIVSASNSKDNFDKKPQISLEGIKKILIDQDLICISGYYGSTLWNKIVKEGQLKEDWNNLAYDHCKQLNDIFGMKNVYLEIQLFDNFYHQADIGKEIRQWSKDNSIQRIAGIESYYSVADDSADQRILLCSGLKTTLPEISKKIVGGVDTGYNHFFNSDKYHILDNDTIMELYDEEEINNTIVISNQCESFSPLSKPILPKFCVPDNFKNESEYLRDLCRAGWRKKIQNIVPNDQIDAYVDRIKYELDILDGAGLSSYFLIVRDILQFVRNNGWIPGPGRGSAAGCLVSYLIDITNIDPIKYQLLFERFYNAGRNTKDRISMPDIDVDVPIEHRDTIIEYIKNKYGEDRVAQMITFNTLKGRGALKEVLRVYNNLSFEEMNNITKHIPDEAKIADELQEIKDEDGEASIIRWSLENYPEKFKDWCFIDENGQLSGPLAKRFEQAIRIEGTKYNQSKHAAGIAISAQKLGDICPMILDTKTKKYIAGLEMNDLDALGVIKFDILGIALLDKMMSVNDLISTRSKI